MYKNMFLHIVSYIKTAAAFKWVQWSAKSEQCLKCCRAETNVIFFFFRFLNETLNVFCCMIIILKKNEISVNMSAEHQANTDR